METIESVTAHGRDVACDRFEREEPGKTPPAQRRLATEIEAIALVHSSPHSPLDPGVEPCHWPLKYCSQGLDPNYPGRGAAFRSGPLVTQNVSS